LFFSRDFKAKYIGLLEDEVNQFVKAEIHYKHIVRYRTD